MVLCLNLKLKGENSWVFPITFKLFFPLKRYKRTSKKKKKGVNKSVGNYKIEWQGIHYGISFIVVYG